MKAAIIILVVLALLSICVYAQAAHPDASRAADENDIRQLIKEINQAYVGRNFEPFERIYLDNYVAVRSKPQYNYREQLIAMMKYDAREISAGKTPDFQTISYDNDVPQIHFFGNTAIVNVLKRNSWKYKVDKCTSRYQATEVWVKRDGSWRTAATQTTTFPCETAFFYPPHPAVAAIPQQTNAPPNNDRASEAAIRTTLEQLTSKLTATQAGGYDQFFADDFVSTNTDGEVNAERAPFLAAFQMRSAGIPRLSRREEALMIYDDTAVFMFRVKPKAKPGETEVPVQVSTVLVNLGGRWQIVAAHLSKVTTND
jgi:hypothetical protein